jgi:membrane protease YdiL (CAAX protease family)
MGHSHANLEMLSLGFDILLLIVGVVMAFAATKIPSAGAIGKTVRAVVTGALILGFAHLVETILAIGFDISTEANELIHRGVIMLGFVFLYFGIKGLADSLASLRKSQAQR